MKNSSVHILLITNNEKTTLDLRSLLKELPNVNYLISLAKDIPGAVAHSRSNHTDLILLETIIPTSGDIEALTAFRLQIPDLPIVLITNKISIETKQNALAQGAQDIIDLKSSTANSISNSIIYAIKRSNVLVEIETTKLSSEAALKVKREFMASMAHEIRTPINGIIGALELLSSADLDQEHQEYLNIIKFSANSLHTLIGEILDFSKIEASALHLDPVPFSLREYINNAASAYAFQACQSDIALHWEIAADVPNDVIGDFNRIGQILTNLVANAIKFTKPGGSIKVNVSAHSKTNEAIYLQFSVTDNGVGISKEAQKNLFKPFIQASISTSREYGGTGLGLSICSKLVEIMDGKIWVESELNQGSTFFFVLKLGLENSIPTSLPGKADTKTSLKAIKSSLAAVSPIQTKSLNILLVEDNQINQRVALKLLEKAGHKVTVAENGQEALDVIKTEPFDLIFMDCEMPILNGFEATKLIRSEESQTKSHIPIIAFTACGVVENQQKCLEVGMDDYLNKPVTVAALNGIIKKHCPKNKLT